MISELVCPNFYVDRWRDEGRSHTRAAGEEFEDAADDGVCRVRKTERDEHGITFICRCGMRFKAADAKHVEVW